MSDNLQFDWTRNELGASNSSDTFNRIVDAVAQLIRNEAASLIGGNVSGAARLIVAQLAHVHGLAPEATARQAAAQDAYERAIRLADGYDVPCDPRTDAEETAHQIVRGIRALAAAEAGKEGDGEATTNL